MTVNEAFYKFFSGFGIEAFEENSVGDRNDAPTFPYLTYSCPAGFFEGGDCPVSVNLWYRDGLRWTMCDKKAAEIAKRIGRSGITLNVDGGVIWLKYSSPLMQNMSDPNDDFICRKYINLQADYITN